MREFEEFLSPTAHVAKRNNLGVRTPWTRRKKPPVNHLADANPRPSEFETVLGLGVQRAR